MKGVILESKCFHHLKVFVLAIYKETFCFSCYTEQSAQYLSHFIFQKSNKSRPKAFIGHNLCAKHSV